MNISLDEIETTSVWRAECEEPVMEVDIDCIEDDHDSDSDHGDDTHTQDLDENFLVPQEFHGESRSVPQSESEEIELMEALELVEEKGYLLDLFIL